MGDILVTFLIIRIHFLVLFVTFVTSCWDVCLRLHVWMHFVCIFDNVSQFSDPFRDMCGIILGFVFTMLFLDAFCDICS